MAIGKRSSSPVAVLAMALTIWATVSPADAVSAAPAQPRPEITAGPATGLADGQRVAVTGHGFAPHQALSIYECATADFRGLVDCDLGTVHRVRADADGSVSTELPVYAVIDTWGTATGFTEPGPGEGVDCREPGACVLATDISFQEIGAAVTAPISFAPHTEEHLPAITVSPGEGVIDRQEVRVEGRGFARSERPLVRIHQCGTDPEIGEICRGPLQEADLDDEGGFEATVPLLTTWPGLTGDIDCRTAAGACHVEAVAAGLNRTRRTAARAPLAFDPDAPIPNWPRPQVTATATVHHGDMSDVTLHGSGFTPGGSVTIAQCPADGDCFMYVAGPRADARGTVDTTMTLPSNIETSGDPGLVDCRGAPGCVLHVFDDERGIEVGALPVTFGDPEPGRRYLDPVFDEVDVDRDVVYRETVDSHGNPVQLRLNIYRPRGDTATSRPATVWMHGGWFRGGDRTGMEGTATTSARYGQVGVSIDYRVRPDARTWRDMYLASMDAYDDATAAVEWLRRHADEYGVDPDAIFAGGFSAGAVTALNLAYLPGQRGPARSLVAAAMPESGLLYTPPERGEPPTIAFHGTNDDILPYDNLATLCPQAALVDVPCELVTYDGGGHGVGSPEERAWRGSTFVAEHVLEPRGYFDVAADAGGPYVVEEGSTVALDATGSTGDGLGYAWSPADRVDDPAAATPGVAGLDDGTETLGLTVANSHGVTDRAEAALTTTNVAPSIDTMTLSHGSRRRSVALEASVTDPGVLDTHTATVDWGDGTTEPAIVEQAGGSATVVGTHTYARRGVYQVTLTVADDDGGTDESTRRAACR